ADSFQELQLQRRVIEEPASRPCVADSGLSSHNSKPFARSIGVTTDNDYRSRSHVLLLADHLVHALVQVVGKGFFRMFEQSVTFTGLTWGHRGRQIDEPFWIYCKSGHHLYLRGHSKPANEGEFKT